MRILRQRVCDRIDAKLHYIYQRRFRTLSTNPRVLTVSRNALTMFCFRLAALLSCNNWRTLTAFRRKLPGRRPVVSEAEP